MFFLLPNREMTNIAIGQCAQGIKAPIPSSFNSLSREIIDSCWNFDPKIVLASMILIIKSLICSVLK